MAFRGINPDAQEKINSWRLPGPVIDGFVKGLSTLWQLSPSQLPADSEGLFFVVDVDDVIDPRGGYVFTLRLKRNDVDFWAADVRCFEVNGGGDIIWSSKNPTL